MAKTFNIELHNRIIAAIEANPENWNQSIWHCGTSHCYAGFAQILSGQEANEETTRIQAMEALGLNRRESDIAFRPHSSLEFLKSLPKIFSYDAQGFNPWGVDCEGFDREGFNRGGFNRDGFNRDGFDLWGFDCEGFDCEGFDCEGFNREGFNRDGVTRG